MEDRFLPFANHRAEELGSPAHVAWRCHGANVTRKPPRAPCRYDVVRMRRHNWIGQDRVMSTVSVREFSYNPSAMFARAEKGETIEITRHGKVIATLVPGQQKKRSRIEQLEASGALRRSGKTTSDLDT